MKPSMLIGDNHVAVKPLPDSWALFAPYLKTAPFRVVTEEDVHSSIIYSTTPISGYEPRPYNIYEAKIIGCKVWYDDYMGIKDLIVELDSPALKIRHQQILTDYGVESFYKEYVPHLTLAYDIPDYDRSYKWFINEMIDLCATRYRGQILRFSGEYIEPTFRGSKNTEQQHIDKLSEE